ncbi:hypothetical protein CsatA_026040 [Cannabis sativa]
MGENQINLGYLILKTMHEVFKPSLKRALPYGYLLSYLFPLLGIPIEDEIDVYEPKDSDTLGEITFKFMRYKFDEEEKKWIPTTLMSHVHEDEHLVPSEDEGEEQDVQAQNEEEGEEEVPPIPQAPHFNLEEAFANLTTSMTSNFTTLRGEMNNQFSTLQHEMTTIRSDITTLRVDMEQGFDNMQEEMTQWRAYMDRFGPPPN